jgi:hypothetical protein
MRSRSWWCVNPMIRRLLALALVNLTACLALFGLCSTGHYDSRVDFVACR